jgi:hypothetical protein
VRPRKKIRAKRTRKYKSQLELAIARKLGKKATYETEFIQYLLPKRYKPDFVIKVIDNDLDGSSRKIYLEVKGYFRYEDQVKMKAVKHCNPDLDIRLYFPNDGKVQSSTMRNSEWCTKYGFIYYIGRLPKDL